MITLDIPGKDKITLEHLVLDYNGTLAIDGKLIPGVKELLKLLSERLTIHVITANTFGTVQENLTGTNIQMVILSNTNQQQQKADYVSKLNHQQVVAIGNGANDALMLKSSAIGIVVVQAEGASAKTFATADIVCTSIIDALELLKNPLRISATLRT
jgi:P-type E1-E2 ATPase